MVYNTDNRYDNRPVAKTTMIYCTRVRERPVRCDALLPMMVFRHRSSNEVKRQFSTCENDAHEHNYLMPQCSGCKELTFGYVPLRAFEEVAVDDDKAQANRRTTPTNGRYI